MLQHFRIPPQLQRLQPPPSAFCLCSLSSHSMKSFMSLSRSLAKRRKGRHQRSEGRPPRGTATRACAQTQMRPRRYAHVHRDECAAEPRAAPAQGVHLNCKALNKKSKLGGVKQECTLAGLQPWWAVCTTPCITRLRGRQQEAWANILLLSWEDGAHTHTPREATEGTCTGEINVGARKHILQYGIPPRRCTFNFKCDCPNRVSLGKLDEK